MPNHLVLYDPDHAERLGYLVAHECGHILRLHEAPPEYRKLPATRAEHRWRVAYELAQDLYRMESLGLKANRLAVLLRMWHDGVIRQLGNFPVDMRIERWLFDEYPGLRAIQREALAEQLREGKRTMGPSLREFTPPKVYRASNFMNAAYARYVDTLLRANRFRAYGDTEFYGLGRRWGDEVWETPDRGYRGDIETIENWSHALGLDGWWEWRQL